MPKNSGSIDPFDKSTISSTSSTSGGGDTTQKKQGNHGQHQNLHHYLNNMMLNSPGGGHNFGNVNTLSRGANTRSNSNNNNINNNINSSSGGGGGGELRRTNSACVENTPSNPHRKMSAFFKLKRLASSTSLGGSSSNNGSSSSSSNNSNNSSISSSSSGGGSSSSGSNSSSSISADNRHNETFSHLGKKNIDFQKEKRGSVSSISSGGSSINNNTTISRTNSNSGNISINSSSGGGSGGSGSSSNNSSGSNSTTHLSDLDRDHQINKRNTISTIKTITPPPSSHLSTQTHIPHTSSSPSLSSPPPSSQRKNSLLPHISFLSSKTNTHKNNDQRAREEKEERGKGEEEEEEYATERKDPHSDILRTGKSNYEPSSTTFEPSKLSSLSYSSSSADFKNINTNTHPHSTSNDVSSLSSLSQGVNPNSDNNNDMTSQFGTSLEHPKDSRLIKSNLSSMDNHDNSTRENSGDSSITDSSIGTHAMGSETDLRPVFSTSEITRMKDSSGIPSAPVTTNWITPESWDVYFADEPSQASSSSSATPSSAAALKNDPTKMKQMDSLSALSQFEKRNPNKPQQDNKHPHRGHIHHNDTGVFNSHGSKMKTQGEEAANRYYKTDEHEYVSSGSAQETQYGKDFSSATLTGTNTQNAVNDGNNEGVPYPHRNTVPELSGGISGGLSHSQQSAQQGNKKPKKLHKVESGRSNTAGSQISSVCSMSQSEDEFSTYEDATDSLNLDTGADHFGMNSSSGKRTPKKSSSYMKIGSSGSQMSSPSNEFDEEFDDDDDIIIGKDEHLSFPPELGRNRGLSHDAKENEKTKENGKALSVVSSLESGDASGISASVFEKSKSIQHRAIELSVTELDLESKMSTYERYYNDFRSIDLNKRYAIRIFNLNDGTFTTLSCTIGTTVMEMIPMVKRKFNVTSSGLFQISLKIGKLPKVLHPHSKPISIQLRLLLLSGYRKHHDPLHLLGIEDLSFVFQFLFHPIKTSQLSRQLEAHLLEKGDFSSADLRDMDLTKPPIIFYQKAKSLKSLDISNNANITLPIDFIELAVDLSSLRMVNIRASKFPQNITEIRNLVVLDLSRNFIKKIPSTIQNLVNLTVLNLQCNKLEKLPKGFGQLKKLQVLDLSSNLFVAYPESLNTCTNLVQMSLSNNKIQSIPSSINALQKLVKLNVSNNRLKVLGDLSQMKSLRTVSAKFNQITVVATNSQTLNYLQVAGNRISDFKDSLPCLRMLEMPRNPLTSLFESNLFLSNLTTLILNKANLSFFPQLDWSKLSKLRILELNENNLTQLPSSIGDLTSLVHLSVNRNKLEDIPETLTKLRFLETLDLHSNNITDLCANFADLKLKTLNVSSNMLHSWQSHLTDTIADSLREIEVPIGNTLEELFIADNRLNNSSWKWLNLFKNLKKLNISYNMLTELEYSGGSQLSLLTHLYTSGNMITSLSGEFISKNLRNLQVLSLNDNRLHSLPSELSLLSNLTNLDVGDNLLKYNISNYEYDWNWINNKKLKYLNFSGNRRFEIVGSNASAGEYDYADLTHLTELRVLGLMDVTLKTFKVPDESFDLRLRTIESSVNGMGYGVADTLGKNDYVSSRDFTAERFRGKSDESLICLFEGKNENTNTSNKIPKVARDLYTKIFVGMLEKYGDSDERSIKSALRHSFLQLNKELNTLANASENNGYSSSTHGADTHDSRRITPIDLSSGATATVVFVKGEKVYTANIGDTMAVLTKSTGDHIVLTKKHSPNELAEYIRIRIAGGYVENDRVDAVSDVSRAIGFFHLLPHIHASPDINVFSISPSDEMVIMATNKLWEYIDYETASDIARENKSEPMTAAAKLKDYAIAYGCEDTLTVICFSMDRKQGGNNNSQFTINRSDLINMRKNAFEDTTLRRLQPEIPAPQGNIAIVFTDIKNSTRLWELHQYAMRSALKIHNSIMRRQLRIFGGFEVKNEGDAFMVAFPTPLSALNWCLSVQLKLLEAEWPDEILGTPDGCLISDQNKQPIFYGLSVRMGIHWGSPWTEIDTTSRRTDYMGPMVNKASRVSTAADGGQIALSSDFITEFNNIHALHERASDGDETMKEVYGDDLLAEVVEREIQILDEIGYVFRELGEVKLKNIEGVEFITLVYPDLLKERFNYVQKEDSSLVNSAETLFYLREISLKLEFILSCTNGGAYTTASDSLSSPKYSKFTKETKSSLFGTKADECLSLEFLDHLVTRIETVVLSLSIRQHFQKALICSDKSANDVEKSLFEMLDELLLAKKEQDSK